MEKCVCMCVKRVRKLEENGRKIIFYDRKKKQRNFHFENGIIKETGKWW